MALHGRILYVVTFDAIEAAVTWQVAEFAKAWQAPVILLAVARPRWLGFLGGELCEDLKPRLVDVARRLRRLKGPVAGVKVALGEPVTEVLRAARNTGAGLVMIGAGERSQREPSHASDFALELAHRTPQDVWICKPCADPHIEHILCAADTSPRAGDALERSAAIGRRFNARLRVLSVLPEPRRGANGSDPEAEAHALHQAQKEFLDGFDLRGLALSRAVVWARDAATELRLEAERYSDGLLVMGASSDLRVRSAALGATADPVLRACPSSLLIVKRNGLRLHQTGEEVRKGTDLFLEGSGVPAWEALPQK